MHTRNDIPSTAFSGFCKHVHCRLIFRFDLPLTVVSHWARSKEQKQAEKLESITFVGKKWVLKASLFLRLTVTVSLKKERFTCNINRFQVGCESTYTWKRGSANKDGGMSAWHVSLYRLFSHDVTAAIFVYKTMNRQPCLCTKTILWKLISFHMLKLSFVPSNYLQSCWPRDWKRSIEWFSPSGFFE